MAKQWIDGVLRTVNFSIGARLFAMPCLLRITEISLEPGGPEQTLFRCGCVLVTLSGRGRLRRDGEEYELTPGTACVSDPGAVATSYGCAAGQGESWRFYEILFASGAAGFMPQISEMYGPVVSLKKTEALADYMEDFFEGRRQCMGIDNFLALEYWAHLLYVIYDGAQPWSRRVQRSELAGAARHRIDCDFARIGTVAELAAGFGVSRGGLSRIFAAEFGGGIHEYLTQVRVTQAATLLCNTNLSCKEIAQQVGFRDMSAFFRSFRRLKNRTPEEFRSGPVRK